MAVIAGVWQRKNGRLREGVIADLLAALHAPFHGVLSAYDDDRLVMGGKSIDRASILSHSGIIVALTGRLDDEMDAEDVLDAYMDDGNGGLTTLAGDYALAVHDSRRHTLILIRDPVGTQPLYYHAGDHTFAFGSQIKAVLAGAALHPRPNKPALAQLLVTSEGTPHGETCFAEVRSLPPGQALFVTADTISSAPFAQLRPLVPTALRTFDQSSAAFRRALCQSVNRRIARERGTAVLVSGGLDSAAIMSAAAAGSARDRLLAISYGASDNGAADERKYVQAVVASTGVRAVHFDLEPTGFPDLVDSDVWASEGPIVDEVIATLARAASAARTHHSTHLLLGTWGDQLLFPFPPPYMAELVRNGQWRRYRQYARTIAQHMADVPVSEVRRALLRNAARNILPARILNMVSHNGARNTVFDSLQPLITKPRRPPVTHVAALRRHVTSGEAVGAMEGTTKWGWANGVEAQMPFLDADLLQLLLAIPAEHSLNEGIPKALLRSSMNGLVPMTVLERKDKGDYTEALADAFQRVHQHCVDRLEDCSRFVKFGLMSRDSASRTLARVRRRGEIEMDLIIALVGLDAWLRVFFEAPLERRI